MAILKPKDLTINYEGAWKELYKVIPRCAIHLFAGEGTESIYIEEKMNNLEKKHKNLITIKRRSNPEIVDYCIKKSVEAQMENIHLKRKLREQKGLAITKEGFGKYKEPERKLSNVEGIIRIDEKERKPEKIQSKSMRFLNEIERALYKKNTTYDGDVKHIEFSNTDRYILDRILELKILIPEIKKKPKRKLFDVNLITITDDSLEFNLNLKVTAKKFEYYKSAYNKGEYISWHGLKMRIVELNYSYPEDDTRTGMTFRYLRREKDDKSRS